MSFANVFKKSAALSLSCCLIVLLNMNAYDFTLNVSSHKDLHKANIEIEQAQQVPHGHLTKRNTQFAIRRGRANILLKGLVALIATVAIGLVLAKCLRHVKPSAHESSRRLSEYTVANAPCLVKYEPLNGTDTYAFRSNNNRRDSEGAATGGDKATCDTAADKKEDVVLRMTLEEDNASLLAAKMARNRTFTKRMHEKAKRNKVAVILGAVAFTITAVVIISLAVHLYQSGSGSPNADAAKHTSHVEENTAAPQSEVEAEFKALQAEFKDLQSKYEDQGKILHEKTVQVTKLEKSIETEYKPNAEFDDLSARYEKLEGENSRLNGEHEALEQEHSKLQGEYKRSQEDYKEARRDLRALDGDHTALLQRNHKLQGEHDELKAKFSAEEQKYETLADKYNESTKDYTTMVNRNNLLDEKLKGLQKKFDEASALNVHDVMSQLRMFNARVWEGIHDCNAQLHRDFDGNTLYHLRKEWDGIPFLQTSLKMDPVYESMTKINEIYKTNGFLTKEKAKPLLEAMARSLGSFLKTS